MGGARKLDGIWINVRAHRRFGRTRGLVACSAFGGKADIPVCTAHVRFEGKADITNSRFVVPSEMLPDAMVICPVELVANGRP